ncbi:MAG: class I SAM-dependent methyltransferase, partial [Candidatus Dormibacteraceae bacterium]
MLRGPLPSRNADISPRPIEKVNAELGALGVRAELGDARKLPSVDSAADAVLVLGPLYHVTEGEDRLTALREAAR